MKVVQNPNTKPYYKCLSCSKFRTECGGMPTRGMDLKEWCEYLRIVKEAFHLTNSYIASKAEVSLTTVERIMALNCDQDIMRYTARRIETVVLGNVGAHFCMNDDSYAAEHIEKLKREIEFLLQDNARKAKVIDRLLEK